MSVTVHQILSDAKRLVSRLKEHDSVADNIISQTQTLYKNVEAMKEVSIFLFLRTALPLLKVRFTMNLKLYNDSLVIKM